jgi:hypothetical protein
MTLLWAVLFAVMACPSALARTTRRSLAQAACPCGSSYTVQQNTALQAIAQGCELTPSELAAANGVQQSDLIQAGNTLTIPGCNDGMPAGTMPASSAPPASTAAASSTGGGSCLVRLGCRFLCCL